MKRTPSWFRNTGSIWRPRPPAPMMAIVIVRLGGVAACAHVRRVASAPAASAPWNRNPLREISLLMYIYAFLSYIRV